MFHRCIAVLLVAVSLFLHAAPAVMAASSKGLPGVEELYKEDRPVGELFTVGDYLGGSKDIGLNPVSTTTFSVPVMGTEGLWNLPDVGAFFAANPYLSKLICMVPGFVTDLLNIAAGIFGVIGAFLSILGIFVTDPSNTITNIQQLVTLTQQLKSMFEQCKAQKNINSVLGTTASPAQLGIYMAHVLGRHGASSFQSTVRHSNPQWFGGEGSNGISLNSPRAVLDAGLKALSTVQLFTGAIGEITGNEEVKKLAEEMGDAAAKARSLINIVFATIQIFTNIYKNLSASGDPISKAQQIAGVIIAVMGPFKSSSSTRNYNQCNQLQGNNEKIACMTEVSQDTLLAVEAASAGYYTFPKSGKVQAFEDKKLSSSSDMEATEPGVVHEALLHGLTGRHSNEPKSDCQISVTEYRLQAARNCALKCAAASVNYVNNNAIKVQQLITNSGGCVVAGQSLPSTFCPTLTEVVANSGSVRGDIQSLVAIEFYGLTADLAMGEVTALCTACEGIKGLIGTPTECQ